MTIRRQILLFVLPLFVVFGVLSSAFSGWLELSKTEASHVEASESLAITTAEFIEPGDINALRQGTPLAQTRLGPITDRLLRWGYVRRFCLIDPQTGRTLADTAAGQPPVATLADLSGLKPGEVRPLAMRPTLDGESYREPILTFTSGSLAVLAVEVSADEYIAARRGIVRIALLYAIVVAIVGLVIAQLLGAKLSLNVGHLRRAVGSIGKPEFASTPAAGGVHEIADLASTFAVMHNVHVETAERTQRSLAEADFHRDERSLAEVYHSAVPSRGVWSEGSISAAWIPIGEPCPAVLAGVVPTGPGAGVAFVGIAGPPGDLEAALRADAAHRFLIARLRQQPAIAAAQESAALFGLTELRLLVWNPAGLARLSNHSESESAPEFWGKAPALLACLGPINQERLALFLANFPGRPPSRLVGDLPPMLENQEPGVLLVLHRA